MMERKEKFTPKPLTAEKSEYFDEICIKESRFSTVAMMDRVHPYYKEYANLLAAAPELYDALNGLIGESNEHNQIVCVEKEKIMCGIKALKKARGEQ